MAYIRKYRKKRIVKRSTRVNRRRRIRRNKGNPRVVYPVAPPPRQRICLKYADLVAQTLTSSIQYQQFLFRPNDVFDPDWTNVGHQSLFRDQMFAMYSFVRCVAFNFSVIISTDAFTPVEVILYRNDTSTASSHSVAREYSGTKRALVVAGKPVKLSMSSLVDRFLQNRKYTVLTDDKFKQPENSSLGATESCWIALSYYYPGGSSANVFAQWNIKQYCQFSETKQVSSS